MLIFDCVPVTFAGMLEAVSSQLPILVVGLLLSDVLLVIAFPLVSFIFEDSVSLSINSLRNWEQIFKFKEQI